MKIFYKYRAVLLSAVFLSVCLWVCDFAGAATRPLQVVASSTLFADLVKKIGGEHVTVKSIASPKFNVHFYEPKPSDVQNVRRADVFVHWGLDVEAWCGPLLEAAAKPDLFFNGSHNIDLSRKIHLEHVPEKTPSRSEGDIHLHGNPHYPMNPENMRLMAETLRDRLSEIDSASAGDYEKNTAAFLNQLDQKIAEWKGASAACRGKEIISYHDDVLYLTDFLGVKSEEFLEPKPGIPPTPQHIAFLEKYAKEKGIRVIAMPTYFSKSAAQVLAERIGAKVVTVCQNAGEVQGTDDVFGFYDYNIKQLIEGLR